MNDPLFKAVQEGLRQCRFPIIAAAIFGSRAKGTATPQSDLDLLVLSNRINPKPHRRGEDIAEIKKDLPKVPIDILLLTQEEAQSNFRNHNPLFLDLAHDGIVLLDDQGWMQRLTEEARNYVKEKGIRKTASGWIFSVTRGLETYLSKVSNKDFALAMIKDGERDHCIGESLMSDGYFDKAVYHFQQAVEKCIKSILISMGVFEKTHFVGTVLLAHLDARVVPPEWRDELRKLAEMSLALEPEVNLSRYPGIIRDSLWIPLDEYERADAETAMKKSAHVVAAAKKFVAEWFSPAK